MAAKEGFETLCILFVPPTNQHHYVIFLRFQRDQSHKITAQVCGLKESAQNWLRDPRNQQEGHVKRTRLQPPGGPLSWRGVVGVNTAIRSLTLHILLTHAHSFIPAQTVAEVSWQAPGVAVWVIWYQTFSDSLSLCGPSPTSSQTFPQTPFLNSARCSHFVGRHLRCPSPLLRRTLCQRYRGNRTESRRPFQRPTWRREWWDVIFDYRSNSGSETENRCSMRVQAKVDLARHSTVHANGSLLGNVSVSKSRPEKHTNTENSSAVTKRTRGRKQTEIGLNSSSLSMCLIWRWNKDIQPENLLTSGVAVHWPHNKYLL